MKSGYFITVRDLSTGCTSRTEQKTAQQSPPWTFCRNRVALKTSGKHQQRRKRGVCWLEGLVEEGEKDKIRTQVQIKRATNTKRATITPTGPTLAGSSNSSKALLSNLKETGGPCFLLYCLFPWPRDRIDLMTRETNNNQENRAHLRRVLRFLKRPCQAPLRNSYSFS
jgi:hypothetical protein